MITTSCICIIMIYIVLLNIVWYNSKQGTSSNSVCSPLPSHDVTNDLSEWADERKCIWLDGIYMRRAKTSDISTLIHMKCILKYTCTQKRCLTTEMKGPALCGYKYPSLIFTPLICDFECWWLEPVLTRLTQTVIHRDVSNTSITLRQISDIYDSRAIDLDTVFFTMQC